MNGKERREKIKKLEEEARILDKKQGELYDEIRELKKERINCVGG